jgi:phage/plasmid-like protein (TIGR03299 family)
MGAIPEMMAWRQEAGERDMTPWHRVGVEAPDDASVQDYFELGGLDYQIVKRPILDADTFSVLDRRFLLKRDMGDRFDLIGKKPLIVSDRYELIQNDAILDVVEGLNLQPVTAGTMFNSSMVWMLLDMGDSVMFQGTDEATHRYLLVATHHGTGNFIVALVNVRVVCQNTYELAIAGGDLRWSIKHTSSAKDRLWEAKKALTQAYRGADELDREIYKLMEASFSHEQFATVVDELVPVVHAKYDDDGKQINTKAQNAAAESRGQLRSIWRGETETISRHSAFHAIQAVNEWEQHLYGHDKNRDERMMAKFVDRKFPFTKRAEVMTRQLVGVTVG